MSTGPPAVLDLGTSVLRLLGGDEVTFTAVVDDPDGESDLVQVTLESDEGLFYSNMTPAPAGRFVLVLGWDAMHAVLPIEFHGEQARTFFARAADSTGGTGEASTVLTLACLGITPAACDGTCVDLDVEACP